MQDRGAAVPGSEELTQGQRRTLLAVTVSGHGLKHLFNAAFFVLLPEIKAGLMLSYAQIGDLSAIKNILGGIANIPAGYAGDRFIARRAEILGLAIILLGTFALGLGLATNFWTAVIFSSLFSIAITFWHPSAISSLSREFVSRRGFVISIHGTGGSIGETLGPLLAGTLLTIISWKTVLQGSVIPGVLAGLLIWALLRGIRSNGLEGTDGVRYWVSLKDLLRNRRLLLVLVFAGGFVGGQSIFLTFFPDYLKVNLGASSAVVGWYMSLSYVGGIASQPVMGYASDRLGRKAILAPSLAVLGVCFLLIPTAPGGWPLALVVLAMGAFLFPLMAILLAAGVDLVGTESQATTVAMVFGSAFVVAGFAPGIAGRLADSQGIEVAFALGAGIVLATSLLSTVTQWRPKVPSVQEG